MFETTFTVCHIEYLRVTARNGHTKNVINIPIVNVRNPNPVT